MECCNRKMAGREMPMDAVGGERAEAGNYDGLATAYLRGLFCAADNSRRRSCVERPDLDRCECEGPVRRKGSRTVQGLTHNGSD